MISSINVTDKSEGLYRSRRPTSVTGPTIICSHPKPTKNQGTDSFWWNIPGAWPGVCLRAPTGREWCDSSWVCAPSSWPVAARPKTPRVSSATGRTSWNALDALCAWRPCGSWACPCGWPYKGRTGRRNTDSPTGPCDASRVVSSGPYAWPCKDSRGMDSKDLFHNRISSVRSICLSSNRFCRKRCNCTYLKKKKLLC